MRRSKRVQGALSAGAAATGLLALGTKSGGKLLALPKIAARTPKAQAYANHLDRTASALVYAGGGIGGASGLHSAHVYHQESKVTKNLSAFGVQHEVAKRSDPSKASSGKPSFGRQVAGAGVLSVPHSLVAGRKGHKVDAFANEVGGAALGGVTGRVAGGLAGAVVHQPLLGAGLGTLGGAVTGSTAGIRRANRKGYLKAQVKKSDHAKILVGHVLQTKKGKEHEVSRSIKRGGRVGAAVGGVLGGATGAGLGALASGEGGGAVAGGLAGGIAGIGIGHNVGASRAAKKQIKAGNIKVRPAYTRYEVGKSAFGVDHEVEKGYGKAIAAYGRAGAAEQLAGSFSRKGNFKMVQRADVLRTKAMKTGMAAERAARAK